MATSPRPSAARRPSGTPSSSQITVNGSGKANASTRSTGASGSRSASVVEEVVDDGLHTRPQVLDPAHRERGRHQTTQPGVIGRVDREHVPGEFGAGEALGHNAAVDRERGAHVLGESRVVERRAGVVVTHHEPGVVTVGQGDVVDRAERTHFGKEREGVVAVVGAPRVERGLYPRARSIARRERIDGAIRHGRTPSTEFATT